MDWGNSLKMAQIQEPTLFLKNVDLEDESIV
jgi:hypothetical protein